MSKQGWSRTERGAVTFQQGYVEGYGAPGYAWCRAVCENRQLERIECSENDLSLELYKLKQKWSEPPASLETFELASQWCDHCKGDTLEGSISCVEKVFCRKCEPFIDGYKDAYKKRMAASEQELNARAESQKLAHIAAVEARKSGAFHWKDNWFFRRTADGSVNLFHAVEEYLHPDLVIPQNEWSSIIAQCSAHGEINGGWERALKFHNSVPSAQESTTNEQPGAPSGEVAEVVEEMRYFIRNVGNRVPSQVQLEQWAALLSKVGQTQSHAAVNWTTEGCPKHHGQSWIMSVPVVYTEIGKRCPICNPPPPERP